LVIIAPEDQLFSLTDARSSYGFVGAGFGRSDDAFKTEPEVGRQSDAAPVFFLFVDVGDCYRLPVNSKPETTVRW